MRLEDIEILEIEESKPMWAAGELVGDLSIRWCGATVYDSR